MNPKKIVITGGPGTGKTSLINKIEEDGHSCLHEISRSVTLEARAAGIEQLFISHPLLFSQKLLEGRIKQHQEASAFTGDTIFLDRGIPDVVAYMDCFGETYDSSFSKACQDHPYEKIFLLPPWEEIYVSDNERFENYEQAVLIHEALYNTYSSLGYDIVLVPKDSVENRVAFIYKALNLE